MLVLTRKIGETIVVGDDVTVTVVDIVGGSKVRIAINAPPSVPVYREEVWEAIQAANRAAADVSPDAPGSPEPPNRRPDGPRPPR